jgi:glycosyltransferase involved in cell wall biosynthesis
MSPIPVLFTHYGEQWLRGSEQLLLDLLAYLDPARIHPIVWCNGTAMAEATKALGVTTYRSDFAYYFQEGSPRFSPRAYAALVRRGREIVDAHAVRVLHANSAAPTQWLVPVARRRRLPLLSHLHIDYLRRARFLLLLHQADLVVGVSNQVIEDFLADGMAPARTAVIYNGIDFARLGEGGEGGALRTRLGVAADAVVITSVGSLIRRKGQDILLRAFQPLASERDAHLLIVSDGPERGNLERLAADLGLMGRVHFLGYHDDIPGVYAASDIIALASRGDAFGLVLAEAAYFARPVVATRVGGIPEVVDDGVTGLLVPPEDPAALGVALRRLADDPALRAAFGQAGRLRSQRMFAADAMAARFMDTYERLAALPPAGLGWGRVPRSAGPYLRLLARAGRGGRGGA